MASCAARLYRHVDREASRILSKYMFEADIQEFKNSKVLGKMRECQSVSLELSTCQTDVKAKKSLPD